MSTHLQIFRGHVHLNMTVLSPHSNTLCYAVFQENYAEIPARVPVIELRKMTFSPLYIEENLHVTLKYRKKSCFFDAF